MRAFLRAYQVDAHQPLNVNQIGKISRSESRRRYFEIVSGKAASDLMPSEIDALRGPVQKLIATEIGDYQVVKTHNARLSNDGKCLAFPEFTRRAIYVVRNPLDVVDSLADHNNLKIDDAISLMADPTHSIGSDDSEFVTQYLLSWSRHVLSWIRQDEFPTLVVRYEDILLDPTGIFRQVLKFLGWPLDQGRIVRSAKYSSFDKLRDFESTKGFGELSDRSKSGTFFRQGKSGDWKKRLSIGQQQRLAHDHRDVMTSLGYLA